MTKDEAVANFVSGITERMDMLENYGRHVFELCATRNTYFIFMDALAILLFAVVIAITVKYFGGKIKKEIKQGDDGIEFKIGMWAIIGIAFVHIMVISDYMLHRIFFSELSILMDFLNFVEKIPK